MKTILVKSILWSSKQQSYLHNITLVLIGSIVIAISAQLSIPLVPVPITLQSATVIFIGMIYGWRLGVLSVLLYLFEGAFGFPVFANMSFGLAVLFGPTSGYLFGFIPAVAISGFLMQNFGHNSFLKAFFAAVLSALVIFIFGMLVLANFVGFSAAYLYGVKPFILVESIKLAVLASIAPLFWQRHGN